MRKRIKRTAEEKAAAQARIAELREHERRIRAEIEERRRASESGDRGSS
jgi:hypothetical protein